METELREKKLEEIRNSDDKCASKDIRYGTETLTMDVYRIPLEYLIFNQYNGRIATFVETYEKEHGMIDATKLEGEELIAQFLWDSKKDRNKYTQQDLEDKGQLEYGIVTADGVVIDGNRRLMLLKKNAEKNNNPTAYFKAIILEDTLESNPKEIMKLETTYQMGVDGKVDYNPIQKYLHCRKLINKGFDEQQIANMMGEKPGEITRYLDTLELMDEYLKTHASDGLYRVLEIKKLEGHFVDLNNYLSAYGGERKIQGMDWQSDATDCDDLTKIYFDYMRAGFGVHDIRIIANPAKKKGFFPQKKTWKDFSSDHFDEVEKIKENANSVDGIREANPDIDVVDLISARDKDFSDEVGNHLKKNLGRTTREFDDQNSQDEPFELLLRARKTLEKVDTDVDSFAREEIKTISHDIRKIVEKFIKIVEGKG